MIGRRRPPAPAPNPWEEEGRRLAPQLAGLSSAVVIGLDAESSARVALGAARAVASERRVAVADLVGAPLVLGTLGDAAGAPGIIDSFLRGVSLNDVAQPAADGTPSLFILPRGSEPTLPEEMLHSDRWSRLAAGFAEAGALLLIVARAETPALDALVRQTDGVVSVGDADIPMDWRVIAQAGERVPAAPPPAIRRQRAPSRVSRWMRVSITGVLLVAAGVALWWQNPRSSGGPERAPTPVGAPQPAARAVAPAADTVRVPDPVNPLDSAAAAQFAVELVATNTTASANLWIRERGIQLAGLTVSPVVLGADGSRWHRVIAGAWRDRAGADSLLAALRDEDVLRAGAGAVVRVPLALLLETDVPRTAAAERVSAMAVRGVAAYALLQDDGSVRLYTGAFETAAAAVPLDAALRAAGFTPQVAYRTGRTF
ncbi:MAG: hypothetical protein HY944_03030 [Gemmatimonadetes bacterium]|nr:hypothetical protein [Gemmatimonadota bacterium]